MRRPYWFALAVTILACSSLLKGQDVTVGGRVNVVHHSKSERSSADVVVSLTSTDSNEPAPPGPMLRFIQKNKRFQPHLLAVTPGTQIEFPNQDPFFHDVFSIYRGKPFDLGLYESGAVRRVRFSQPGVSFIFCNIHPEMSAAVIVLRTPHFAVTGPDGSFRISHVPSGHYKLEVWSESSSEAELASQTRDLEIASGDNPPILITLHASGVSREHLNKYGEAYPPVKTDKY
jgi:plastocyanin